MRKRPAKRDGDFPVCGGGTGCSFSPWVLDLFRILLAWWVLTSVALYLEKHHGEPSRSWWMVTPLCHRTAREAWACFLPRGGSAAPTGPLAYTRKATASGAGLSPHTEEGRCQTGWVCLLSEVSDLWDSPVKNTGNLHLHEPGVPDETGCKQRGRLSVTIDLEVLFALLICLLACSFLLFSFT